MSVARIGVLTSGGDCPGLNAVIRAVVKSAVGRHGLEVVGIRDGFQGLLTPPRTMPLGWDDVRGLLPRGGTILGTSNRGNPFSWSDGTVEKVDRSSEIIANAAALGIDRVVAIGGDGSLAIARDLAGLGLGMIGVPKTIDNDIAGTDLSFGFDSAVATATDAIDKLHTTAESHHRVMLLEVMGRNAGWIALASGLAGGADVVLIPEIPFSIEAVAAKIDLRVRRGRNFSIVVVAEGAAPVGGDLVYVDDARRRLGGMAQLVGEQLTAHSGCETRTTVLGHIQRGGSPTPYDRVLATRFGAAAARVAAEGRRDVMVALERTQVVEVGLAEAIAQPKRVSPDGELVATARAVGISFGDETDGELR